MDPRSARTLRNLLDPLAAVVFFADEAHRSFERLGFASNPDSTAGVRVLDRSAYLMARSACLGQVRATVVASVFAVFKPSVVLDAVERWQPLVPTQQLQDARCDSAVAALSRLLGPPTADMQRAVELLQRVTGALRPEGRLLFAGLQSIPQRDGELFALWHAADLFREHRGSSHLLAWSARGLTGAQACILNDLSQGLRIKSYVRTRGWDDGDLEEAVTSLQRLHLVDDDGLTGRGEALRTEIEQSTDLQQFEAVTRVEREFEELCRILEQYRRRIVESRSYPDRTFLSNVTRWR